MPRKTTAPESPRICPHCNTILVPDEQGEWVCQGCGVAEPPPLALAAIPATLPALPEPGMDVSSVKRGFDDFLEMREHMLRRIEGLMVAGVDYHEIKNKKTGETRKSLGKPGAEKMAAIFKLRASFTLDRDTIEALGLSGKAVAYVCDLRVNGEGPVVGQGRGARLLAADYGDANKCIKMCQKSAYVDAVVRATGVSDLFTQDVEDMGQPQAEEAPPMAKLTPLPPEVATWGQGRASAQRRVAPPAPPPVEDGDLPLTATMTKLTDLMKRLPVEKTTKITDWLDKPENNNQRAVERAVMRCQELIAVEKALGEPTEDDLPFDDRGRQR